ncbi:MULTISPECIES: AAA family ATPase [unclassified Campylobacter]|uniref:AAA family ATPase n=1 Tax=unclassified Campylobacter TaxID=2593542 RepID=UPI0022E9BBA6|nr:MULTISPECIES: AAA family ATPase [unclassified Campylobacter]MDA3053755.1 AAA family ATPase [Campylobacter sp. VBCF_07 NA4]MDA3060356.1 AAA family ATPase [Campylobacter sp. VBCF_02 NA5]MDA3062344.1 AAA family ATPase [Campylobacter sp. JMF_14 EL1]MDA3069866.1 AAA family ATPase [Campylobacter sp. VBCF_08 NA3]MDA3073538.1 AAA family ATPase [Campylobacter sp. JMF_10 EL2]
MKSNLSQMWQKFKANKLNLILVFLGLLIVLLSIVYFKDDAQYISEREFSELMQRDLIKRAHIEDGALNFIYEGKRYRILADIVDLKELANHAVISKSHGNSGEMTISAILVIFTFAFFLFVYYFETVLSRRKKGQNLASQAQNTAPQNFAPNSFEPVKSDVKFSDIAGISEVKDELIQIVDFLKNPLKYQKFGIKLPKGVLMIGAPGVGKTLIAKAVAGEAGVPFFYQSGASFAEMFVGVGAKRVRELFAKAKSCAPAIIFIDEIDAVGGKRGVGRNDEREATLNQLLTEMDGFEENSGVMVIAATNKIDLIDEALLRSGRFDRRIFISLPNYKDRIEILKIYLADKKFDLNITKVSRLCVGFSGAGVATFVNEAAMKALERGSDKIELIDFENVRTKVFYGVQKSQILTENEKEIQAFYQAAKALIAYWYSMNFDKIELLNDKFLNDDFEIRSKTQMLNQIKVLLSGTAALAIHKNDAFTNGSNDVKEATELAQKMVYEYAMGDSFVPNPASVNEILNSCFEDVGETLRTMQEALNLIAKQIFVYEYITHSGVRSILQPELDEDEENLGEEHGEEQSEIQSETPAPRSDRLNFDD